MQRRCQDVSIKHGMQSLSQSTVNKHFLNTHYMPDTVLAMGVRALKQPLGSEIVPVLECFGIKCLIYPHSSTGN